MVCKIQAVNYFSYQSDNKGAEIPFFGLRLWTITNCDQYVAKCMKLFDLNEMWIAKGTKSYNLLFNLALDYICREGSKKMWYTFFPLI